LLFLALALASGTAQSNDFYVGVLPAEGKGIWNSVNPFDQQYGVRRNSLWQKSGAVMDAQN